MLQVYNIVNFAISGQIHSAMYGRNQSGTETRQYSGESERSRQTNICTFTIFNLRTELAYEFQIHI